MVLINICRAERRFAWLGHNADDDGGLAKTDKIMLV
jgi:hypothetical protein